MKRLLFTGVIVLLAFTTLFIEFNLDRPAPNANINSMNSKWELMNPKRIGKDKKDIIMGYPSEFARAFHEIRYKEEGKGSYSPNYRQEEFEKALRRSRNSNKRNNSLDWVERGPANVPGRVRGLVIDPDDATGNTVYAASVGGGVWKTEDRGQSWRKLTEGVINQATPTLAIAPSNPNVMYAGTGEAFGHITVIVGDGIYKSTDRGESWTQLSSTAGDNRFRAVNRIIVDPNDENIVLAVTETGTGIFNNTDGFIFKSTDGGSTWTEVYSTTNPIKQIIHEPGNFNVQYATESSFGILKSNDAGETWEQIEINGLTGRLEIAISHINTNKLLGSAQGSITGSDNGSDADLYFSDDAGLTWKPLIQDPENPDSFNYQIMNGQGSYSNAVAPHPFDENTFYVGGVDLFRVTVGASEIEGDGTVTGVEENGTEAFMDFINFGAPFLRGGLDLGNASDFVSVQLLFGPGVSQKAHRFTVGGQGSGVPPEGFFYQDYVDIPLQAWDISVDPPRQLMVSFRDQQEDGAWNLIPANTAAGDDANHSREYLYIHNVDYSETANSTIAQNGSSTTGHEFEQMYFFWPILSAEGTFDPDNLPASNLTVNFENLTFGTRTVVNATDGRNQYNGENNNQLFPHVDYHGIQTRVVDSMAQTFELYTTSDGGFTYTISDVTPGEQTGEWVFAGQGFNINQPYGIDKKPGENQYILGSQDNGTWFSNSSADASDTTTYEFAIGGDGFECVWNARDPNFLIGGSQFNGFNFSNDGGNTWFNATTGLETGSVNAPFISKLADSKKRPDVLFAVGSQGIYKSVNFGQTWELRSPGQGWDIGSFTDVKISISNPDIVWAGTGMAENLRLQVSIDGGETFSAVNNFNDELGIITGLATHPTEDSTAFALFSFANEPKILRTTDLGQTWEDISGFGEDGSEQSSNGFPNVAVFTLLVRPDEPNTIWAGTEIGLFESTDNGESWALADNGLPNVSVWDIAVVDNQIVVGTHGRGIWTLDVETIVSPPILITAGESPDEELLIRAQFNTAYDSVGVEINGEILSFLTDIQSGTGIITLSPINQFGNLEIRLIGFGSGNSAASDVFNLQFFEIDQYAQAYQADFDATGVEDFVFDGMLISGSVGFEGNALRSLHPYDDNRNHTSILTIPIIVGENLTNITFDNIAIIEPGQAGSEFGEVNFWDFVVVEGTEDGLEWIPVAPGYDARKSENWEAIFDAGGNPRQEDFEREDFDLLNAFSPGDTVLLRFRLFADQLTNGYGWVIDDLFIQTEVLTATQELSDEQIFNVYPNPLDNSTFEYSLMAPGNVTVQIFDLSGVLVESYNLGSMPAGVHQFQPKTLTLNNGVYIAEINTPEGTKRIRVVSTN